MVLWAMGLPARRGRLAWGPGALAWMLIVRWVCEGAVHEHPDVDNFPKPTLVDTSWNQRELSGLVWESDARLTGGSMGMGSGFPCSVMGRLS